MRPAGTSWFSRWQRGGELRRRQAVGAHRVRVHLHADLARVAADDVHAADAGDRLDARLHDLVGEVGDLADRPLRSTAARST